eukprot:CAMPEP_0185847642 /NCGR_PEP_ID=MMETSP1354-20130828/2843_1 /TAXON_ID=708628 /ORGANISM="Erythrolobus madagascarensis, Strain CCMP3276" /LENGTH=368 /DNA_ID=CAMNT_0028547961 /DNA_START=89 /DNA_END=1192 /DNA_ORIENTATION=+
MARQMMAAALGIGMSSGGWAERGFARAREWILPTMCAGGTHSGPQRLPPQRVRDLEHDLLTLGSSRHALERSVVELPCGAAINTVSAGDASKPMLVVAHGYGAGLALFARNIDALADHFRVHLFDWVGFGASSRPVFPRNPSHQDATDFFLMPFGEWLDEIKSRDGRHVKEPVHIMAHSLGGYLAAEFALRSPEDVAQLFLVSPAGVPAESALLQRISTDASLLRRALFSLLAFLWEHNVTPQRIARFLGDKRGKRFVHRYIENRFPHVSASEQVAMAEYFHATAVEASPSGEYALSALLAPGAVAKVPLEGRLSAIQTRVSFAYGEHDWMEPAAGKTAWASVERPDARGDFTILPGTGHFLFVDNPD